MESGGLLREYLNLLGSVYLLALIFYPLELLVPAEKGQALGQRLLNLAYMPLFLAAIIFLLQPVFNLLYSPVLRFTGGGILPNLVNRPSGWTAYLLFALLFAVAWDLWQYCVHRLQHTVPVLWETHKFHHSETAFNSTTQTRHHLLNSVLSLTLYLPVLILFGPQAPHFIAAFVMFRLWGFVNHLNIRLGLGKLTPIISGPQWHRLHHSIYPEHYNKNFATFFPVIDIIFGTYYSPRKDEYPPTGLPPEEIGYLRGATFEPLVAVYQMISYRSDKFKPEMKHPAG